MARPISFKIDNSIDRNNFLKYLENNEKKVLKDFDFYLTMEHTGNSDAISSRLDAFLSLWDEIKKPVYIRDTPQEKIWDDATRLLFMLPPKRVKTIRVSLRAKKTSSSRKRKMISVDADVHYHLAFFAKKHSLSLSAAMDLLLSKSHYLSDADVEEFLKK